MNWNEEQERMIKAIDELRAVFTRMIPKVVEK
jgi:hypothetical protein